MPFDRYLAAAFIDGGKTPRVLGRRLRPFCLWHRLLLLSIESPLLEGRDAELQLFDLRNAIGVCRLGYRQSRIRRPWIVPRRGLLERGRAQFLAYAGNYLVRPEFNVIPPPPVKGARPPGLRGHPPEVIRVVADVMEFTDLPPKQVWEMPIGEAYWYQMLHLRSRGADVDYFTAGEREWQRLELEREAAAEGDTEEEESAERV